MSALLHFFHLQSTLSSTTQQRSCSLPAEQSRRCCLTLTLIRMLCPVLGMLWAGEHGGIECQHLTQPQDMAPIQQPLAVPGDCTSYCEQKRSSVSELEVTDLHCKSQNKPFISSYFNVNKKKPLPCSKAHSSESVPAAASSTGFVWR